MINLEKIVLDLYSSTVQASFVDLLRNLTHVLQRFTGKHLQEIRLDLYVQNIGMWSTEVTGLGDAIESDQEYSHLGADLKLFEQALTQKHSAQVTVVFQLIQGRLGGRGLKHFLPVLQCKLPELYKRSVFQGLWG